jgi:hypothetical protein
MDGVMKISQINKTVLFFLLVVLFASSYKNIIAQDYTLVWSDEFDETSLDLSKWECQIGNGSGGWGNNEKQYYRSENAVVDSGYLTIIAKKENYNNFGYTSARIRTIKKGDGNTANSRACKTSVRKRNLAGVWMMPTDNVYGGWAASGEIDIMEYLGHQTNKVYVLLLGAHGLIIQAAVDRTLCQAVLLARTSILFCLCGKKIKCNGLLTEFYILPKQVGVQKDILIRRRSINVFIIYLTWLSAVIGLAIRIPQQHFLKSML